MQRAEFCLVFDKAGLFLGGDQIDLLGGFPCDPAGQRNLHVFLLVVELFDQWLKALGTFLVELMGQNDRYGAGRCRCGGFFRFG